MTHILNTQQGNRIYFLDNLRTFMIFLVVALHAALVYDSSGFPGFFWIVYDFDTNPIVDELNLILDIFVMSIIFLISGFLTPRSLNSKSGLEFVKTKLKRLMLPWLLGVLILMPLYKVIFLASRGMPQEFWTTYFHWSNGIFSQNWLWFLPVLFLFDLLYLGLSFLKIKMPQISTKQATGLVFILGLITSIIMDMLNLQGWTKNVIINFQNERLLIYFMIFLLGAHFYKHDAFNKRTAGRKGVLLLVLTVWIPIVAYRFFHVQTMMNPGTFMLSGISDTLLHWLSFHLSLAGLMTLLISAFQLFFNKEGRMSQVLSKNSYNVYIIHTIVLGGIGMLMLNIGIPSILKFLLLTATTYFVSNGLVSMYQKLIKPRRSQT